MRLFQRVVYLLTLLEERNKVVNIQIVRVRCQHVAFAVKNQIVGLCRNAVTLIDQVRVDLADGRQGLAIRSCYPILLEG